MFPMFPMMIRMYIGSYLQKIGISSNIFQYEAERTRASTLYTCWVAIFDVYSFYVIEITWIFIEDL